MNQKSEETRDRKKFGYQIARSVAVVSGIFMLIFSILVLANYFQTKTTDPLNSPALETLMGQMEERPDDQALKEQIRALDLLARKAYFTTQWQIRTGGYLIFGSFIVFIVSLRIMGHMKSKLPVVGEKPVNVWESAGLTRKRMAITGFSMAIISILIVILSHSELEEIQFRIDEVMDEAGLTDSAYPNDEILRQNWPGFRGPYGTGIASFDNVPTEWDGPSGQNVLWKTEIPLHGMNSPIRWDNRLFVSGADETRRQVYCYDTDTSEMLWQRDVLDVPGSTDEIPEVSYDTGYAAPTMTTDGERVFAIFANGDLVCFDFEGNQIWAISLGIPQNIYGYSSSLIIYQNRLIVLFDQETGGYLYAFNTQSGRMEWQTSRENMMTWASPICVNTGNRFEIIINANPAVASYDPSTGRVLWSIEGMTVDAAPSVAYADGWAYAVNEYAFLWAIKLEDPPQIGWENIDYLSEISSPVANEKFLFVATSYGDLICFDAKTGDRYWVESFDHGFYSSPILVQDKVYVMDYEGVMQICYADVEYRPISHLELGEASFCIPAFDDNRIFIRGDTHLYCIGHEDE
ncbi:PQQ-like beta-propeller repeat protein [bacterium]|nr:PQQ-like beta-propeller repeat protein [bacterium]